MTLKADMDDDLDRVFFDNDEFSEEIVFNAITLDAIVDREKNLIERNGSFFYLITVHVKNKDVTPARGQFVVVDSDTWTVDHIVYSDSFVSIVNIISKEAYKHDLPRGIA